MREALAQPFGVGFVGIDSVSLHFTPGNMAVGNAERSLRLFAREAMLKVVGL